MRSIARALLLLVLTLPAMAQVQAAAQSHGADPEGRLPGGWQARLDRANASMSNVMFHRMGDAIHVRLGPSGIFYDPNQVGTGGFTARARFSQVEPTRHPEAYGLFVGGQNLRAPDQDYLYFLIRQDGRYLIKHRAGAETHTLVEWTEHPAVIALGSGVTSASNVLSIAAGPQRVRFLVNDVEVAALDNAAHRNTDGVVGLRINHNLEVRVEGFRVDRNGQR
jgi:hypothetical protein